MQAIFFHLKAALAAGTMASSVAALLLAYIGGVISSFTPCIYPMIPITVGFIGGTAERSVKSGWILSTFYVLGMAAVYTSLGLIAAASGKIFGTITHTPGWYLVLGGIMLACSLWMFGVINFDPNVLVSRLLRGRKKQGTKKLTQNALENTEGTMAGAFLLGASSGLVASPCTTPVLTTILSFIAIEHSLAFGGLLMFFFSLGLGTILVVIGTFAGAMKLMPKSGKWLNTVKTGSGLLILLLAEYFIFKAGTLR